VSYTGPSSSAPSRWPGRAAAVCFGASTVASVGLAIVYLNGGQTQLEGAFLAIVSGGIGTGIVLWARHEMPEQEVEEKRKLLTSAEEDVAAFKADFRAGEETIRRRRLLQVLLGAAATAFGVALLFPIRSLGPPPGRGLKETDFRRGRRVVTEGGEPVRPEDVPVDGVITVWPDGHAGAADSSTLLIRPRDFDQFEPVEGRKDWTQEGIVAYSKLCTHTGCPVGLYQAEAALLLCPCHQSTFEVLDGARPIFGPAARPLPQLPLALDGDGYLVADGDFSDPVGPGFWDRGRS
jgi:ubiquinol-cytochrome c reductase iron-sulfur subunit